jgi:tetratricopeptide (TPR) repeat protein
MLDLARIESRDALLLQHYRTTISPHILTGKRSADEEDLFELQAKNYPPLFHAIMALTALSMAHQHRGNNADALEHYQKVIPALKAAVQSSQDSYSDGALFTHFLLLLYEVWIFVLSYLSTNMLGRPSTLLKIVANS